MVAALLTLVSTPQAASSFEDLEQKKYKYFTQLDSFTGTYVIVTVPPDGLVVRQEVGLTATSKGRRVKISVDGVTGLESGWTIDRKWIAFHTDKAYMVKDSQGGFPLAPVYKPLPVEKGSFNFTVDETGVRFATDPPPTVAPKSSEKIDGVEYDKYTSTAQNKTTNGVVTITQHLHKDTFLVSRFEVVLTTKGKQTFKLVGFLQNFNLKATVPANAFDLPADVTTKYRRVEG